MAYLLLENGDRLLLEDGTGALLLEQPVPVFPTRVTLERLGFACLHDRVGFASTFEKLGLGRLTHERVRS